MYVLVVGIEHQSFSYLTEQLLLMMLVIMKYRKNILNKYVLLCSENV